MELLRSVLWVMLAVLSVAMIGLILMHRGRGGGVSDLFGGGIASGIQSSGSGQRLLTRITWVLVSMFGMVIVLLGLIQRFED